jgi:hypothetical protein
MRSNFFDRNAVAKMITENLQYSKEVYFVENVVMLHRSFPHQQDKNNTKYQTNFFLLFNQFCETSVNS